MALAVLVGDHIQIARRVRLVIVCGGWQDTVAQGSTVATASIAPPRPALTCMLFVELTC